MEPAAADLRVMGEENEEVLCPSTERLFEGEHLPSLSETVTARSVAVSAVLGAALSAVAMKLAGLTSAAAGLLLPSSLAFPAGLMGFLVPRAWLHLLERCGGAPVPRLPFTRQENTVILTFVVACSGVAFTGGFGSYILEMNKSSGRGGGGDIGSSDKNVDEPHVGRLVAFLFLTSFAGLFVIMPFRNSLIARQRLTFPTGTAMAHLINSIHVPHGAQQASKQVSFLFKTFAGSVAWSLFQWFFASGEDCGFHTFPTFGLTAYRRGFYFDFSMANVGVGILCPYKTTVSMLVGSLVSWGIMWPYIETKEGRWYARGFDGDDLSGINGYRVFVGVSMILADGLLHLLVIMLRKLHKRWHSQKQAQQPFGCVGAVDLPEESFDDRRRKQVFLRGRMPSSAAVAGYVVLSVVSTIIVPQLYTQLRYHHVAVAYLVAPVLAFCNAYVNGVTDVNIATTYGKIAIVAFGSWVGLKDGGVVAGLAACGIIVATVSTASDLTQAFRTGYLTLTSPRAIFLSQVAGTALGCVINPILFRVFHNGSDGVAAKAYRGTAMLGVNHHGLPRHTVLLCELAFVLALAVGALREVSSRRRWRIHRYFPSTAAMAVAFFVSPKVSIGMFAGSMATTYLWGRADDGGHAARLLSPAVACGLICGDGFWSLLSSTLTLSTAQAPICIKFLSRQANASLDAFLARKATSQLDPALYKPLV